MTSINGGLSYPINYDKTLAQAKKEAAVGKAIESVNDIEDRWVRVTSCEEYTFIDISKAMLLCDIRILLQCNIVFINKIGELEALLKRQRPKGPRREAKEIGEMK